MRSNQSKLSSQLFNEFDRFLKIVSTPAHTPTQPTPQADAAEPELTSDQKNNINGLMRINHTGEICAQALYFGQALFAKDIKTRNHLIDAAEEEHNHLFWCQERLNDLESHTSILNPVWYIGSFVLGASAALFGDKISFGFVIEVEKQVENHLQEHIDQIPIVDVKTHAILSQMKADEIRHGEMAIHAGGIDLPQPIKSVIQGMSKIMKFLVYRI